MRPRAAEDPMQNTWSIGRTWKPREGWSRPVLTDERQHSYSPIRSGTASSSCKRHQTAMSIVWPQDETSTNSRPLSGSQAATRPADLGVWPYKRIFAAVMAQVRRPVPFRTRKLRPGTAMVLHPTGCGRVARRRTTRQGPPDEANNPRGPTHTQTQQPTGMRSTHPIRFTGAAVSEDGSRWSRAVLNAMAALHKPKRT